MPCHLPKLDLFLILKHTPFFQKTLLSLPLSCFVKRLQDSFFDLLPVLMDSFSSTKNLVVRYAHHAATDVAVACRQLLVPVEELYYAMHTPNLLYSYFRTIIIF